MYGRRIIAEVLQLGKSGKALIYIENFCKLQITPFRGNGEKNVNENEVHHCEVLSMDPYIIHIQRLRVATED